MPLHGQRVAFIGRLERLPRWRAVRELQRHGATILARPSRDCTMLVVGHGAHRLPDGRLDREVQRAHRLRAAVLSENRFLTRIGLRSAPAEHRLLSADEVTAKSGLAPEQLELSGCLDLVEPVDGGYSFADLLAARQVARLRAEGFDLGTIAGAVRRVGGGLPPHRILSELAPRRSSDGLTLRLAHPTEDSDQLPLPLALPPGDDPEAMFEEAERAEAEGDLERAAQLYRRCCELDRRDVVALFNLANVLRDLGDGGEAELTLRRAIAAAPAFSEGWYNLAGLLTSRGEAAAAKAALRRSLDAEPGFADALYNLAQLELAAGRFAEAAGLWERYLNLDQDSQWSRTARRALGICRLRLQPGGPA